MSFLDGLGAANEAQHRHTTRYGEEEGAYRGLQRMREADKEAARGRQERETQAGILDEYVGRQGPQQMGVGPALAYPTMRAPAQRSPMVVAPEGAPDPTVSPWRGRTAQPGTSAEDETRQITSEAAKLKALRNRATPGVSDPMGDFPGMGSIYGTDDVSGEVSASEKRLADLRSTAAARRPNTSGDLKAKFIAALHGQESSGGRVDTSQPNYAGARGEMQILEPTFNEAKQRGLIPANFDWANPQHNKAGGEAWAGHLLDKHNGNFQLAAAEYYGGPKAVQNGQIVTFGDRKNPNAPNTNQYAQQIMQRMGQPGVTSQGAQAQPADGGIEPGEAYMPPVMEAANRKFQELSQKHEMLQRLAQTSRDPAQKMAIMKQMDELRVEADSAQLSTFANLAAQGSTQHLTALAKVAAQESGAQFGVADAGNGQVVFVRAGRDGQNVTSQPMSLRDAAGRLHYMLSEKLQAQRMAQQQKYGEAYYQALGKSEGETPGKMQVEELKANSSMAETLAKAGIDQNKVRVTPNPIGDGTAWITDGRGRVFSYAPGSRDPKTGIQMEPSIQQVR